MKRTFRKIMVKGIYASEMVSNMHNMRVTIDGFRTVERGLDGEYDLVIAYWANDYENQKLMEHLYD